MNSARSQGSAVMEWHIKEEPKYADYGNGQLIF